MFGGNPLVRTLELMLSTQRAGETRDACKYRHNKTKGDYIERFVRAHFGEQFTEIARSKDERPLAEEDRFRDYELEHPEYGKFFLESKFRASLGYSSVDGHLQLRWMQDYKVRDYIAFLEDEDKPLYLVITTGYWWQPYSLSVIPIDLLEDMPYVKYEKIQKGRVRPNSELILTGNGIESVGGEDFFESEIWQIVRNMTWQNDGISADKLKEEVRNFYKLVDEVGPHRLGDRITNHYRALFGSLPWILV